MISKRGVEKAIFRAFPNSKIESIKKFEKGLVNRTFDIKIRNPDKNLVLRIFPKDPWKADKEEFLYNLIAKKTDVPVPKIYLIDKSKKIMPYSYLVLSKIEGDSVDKEYEKSKDKKLFIKAGEILAKIHSIKFKRFGWILGDKISPAFKTWPEFLDYDVNEKLKKIRKANIIAKSDVYECKRRIDILESLVEIKDKPCLLHKDYHFSHIIADNNKIGGIIDFEWAIAGHNELDLFKSEQWMFDKLPELKHYFFKGYKKFGNISKEYEQRKKLYEIILLISSIVFSYEMKHKNWLDYNMKKMKKILSRC